MKKLKTCCIILLIGNLSLQGFAQTLSTHQHSTISEDQNVADLGDQIKFLHQKVAVLERQLGAGVIDGSKTNIKGMLDKNAMAMKKMNNGKSAKNKSSISMMGMGKQKMGAMDMESMAKKKQNSMSMGMSKIGGGMMDMMGKGKGMMSMMGMMKNMGNMTMDSTLPGFPGASHIYHIGSIGYFLNHDSHLQLTSEQRSRLNQIKENISLQGASVDRNIEEAEQQLWVLTASDQPDIKSIETKIKEIEKLRSDYRIDVIKTVGEAAEVLTTQQQRTLVGLEDSQNKKKYRDG